MKIEYPKLIGQALLRMVRDLLRGVAAEGLPGEHHFYITFDTRHPAVDIPENLRRIYPEQMTVVLQNEFWDLAVEEDRFSVTLAFGGARRRLTVPFAAIRTFLDPHAELGLKFGSGEPEPVPVAGDAPAPEAGPPPGNVVPLDRFRKK